MAYRVFGSLLFVACVAQDWDVQIPHEFVDAENVSCNGGADVTGMPGYGVVAPSGWTNMYGSAVGCCWPAETLEACKALCYSASCSKLFYSSANKRCDLVKSCAQTVTDSGWTALTYTLQWQHTTCPNWAICNNCNDGRVCSTPNDRRRRRSGSFQGEICCDNCVGRVAENGSTLDNTEWCGPGASSYHVPLILGTDNPGQGVPGKILFPTLFTQCAVNREMDNGDKLYVCTRGIAEHPDGAAKDVAMIGFKVAACWVAAGSTNMACHNHREGHVKGPAFLEPCPSSLP